MESGESNLVKGIDLLRFDCHDSYASCNNIGTRE